jgi:hypothetical protein
MKLVSIAAAVSILSATAPVALGQDNPTSGVHGAIYDAPKAWSNVDPMTDLRSAERPAERPPRGRAARHKRRG